MGVVGRIQSVWRYPVKSMRGEEVDAAYVTSGGLRGDRLYAIHNAKARPDFPYFTAREQGKLLLCRPKHKGGSEPEVTVETPWGETLEVTDDRLLELLQDGSPGRFELSWMKSDKPLTDCRPVSLISEQTVLRLSEELGGPVDRRRFRANLYLDLEDGRGFAEDEFVGHTLRIGPDVVLAAAERDERCKMITLDPDTFEPNPELMKVVARLHNTCAGIYADVLAEGLVRPGDQVEVVD
jgi:uncharacterized protein